jgi:hypothetical protein
VVDIAALQPVDDRLRSQVLQLDLVGGIHNGVRDRLPHAHPGDLVYRVVQALQMLDIQGRDHADAVVSEFLDGLPALRVPGAGDVGVGQLVHEHPLRMARDHRLRIHLVEGRAAVLDRLRRHLLEALKQGRRGRPAVGLHDADDHVLAIALDAPVRFESMR